MTHSKDKSITFQRERFEDVHEEAMPLIHDHAEEVERNLDIIPVDPDINTYLAMQEAGLLGVYTARKGGKLVGYFVISATKSLHSKEHTMAVCDLIYVVPEYRNGNVGTRMIKYVEDDLRRLGVTSLFINSKTGGASMEALLKRLKYDPVEVVYSKCFLRETEVK